MLRAMARRGRTGQSTLGEAGFHGILFTGLFTLAASAQAAWWGHERWASTDLADGSGTKL